MKPIIELIISIAGGFFFYILPITLVGLAAICLFWKIAH